MGASTTGRNTDYRSKWVIRKPTSFYRIPGFVAIIVNIYIYIYDFEISKIQLTCVQSIYIVLNLIS